MLEKNANCWRKIQFVGRVSPSKWRGFTFIFLLVFHSNGRKILVFIMFAIVALLMMIIDYLHRLMILRLCLLGCVASCSIRHWSRVSCVSLHDVINSGPEIGQNQFSLYLLYFRYVLCQIRQHLHHKANRAPCVILCDLFNRL